MNPVVSFISALLLIAFISSPPLVEGINVVTSRGEKLQLYKDYYALVVGVSVYDKRPALPQAVNSAKAIASLLKQMGFTVTLVTDPTANQLKKALTDLAQGPGREPEQGIVFYYAGYGETQSLSDGAKVGWIIPRDCPRYLDDPKGFADRAINMNDITAFSVDIQSRHVLMLFDASFSGAAFSLKSPVLTGITKKSILPARQYIIAGSEGESALEQGIFSQFLLKGLQGDADIVPDGYITGSELGVYLENQVRDKTKGQQRLQYGESNVPSLTNGDFIIQQIGTAPVRAAQGIARITVKTDPETAQVNILNIKQHFSQGMELKPGKYHIEITARGYQPEKNWITLAAGEDKTIDMQLKKLSATITNSLEMQFVFIDPGTFEMGSDAKHNAGFQDEQKHTVTLTKGYYLLKAEVTVGSFQTFITETGYKTDAETTGGCWINTKGGGWKKKNENNWKNPGSPETASVQQRNKLPVTCVSWNDAHAFIKWLITKEGKTYALPTEAEWEYACRAGTTTPFAFGNCLSSDQANYGGIDQMFSDCKSGFRLNRKKPIPVASLSANPWGLFDMHGNIAEWCADWYGPYPSRTMIDPKGPSSGTDRVLRGCHWLNTASECRSAKRSNFSPGSASDAIGFRLVMRP
jgi:formylglycine-generating enzyme required for sulfatase activity